MDAATFQGMSEVRTERQAFGADNGRYLTPQVDNQKSAAQNTISKKKNVLAFFTGMITFWSHECNFFNIEGRSGGVK